MVEQSKVIIVELVAPSEPILIPTENILIGLSIALVVGADDTFGLVVVPDAVVFGGGGRIFVVGGLNADANLGLLDDPPLYDKGLDADFGAPPAKLGLWYCQY
ncbi:hypothetical protein L2E82_14990 [Cichorium intybus]|uniref:Uncharacterized protein n=1 Tax=Cichorium intybus TaxID=13427 RepID=A0ACB9F1I4_CICIN|nr:hypothetical protein L2E82_14990 [Cichorium intybus]